MANNVPFESLDELFGFIMNVTKKDVPSYNFSITELGLRQIGLEECFFKLLYNCGFDWIPTEDEMELVWQALAQLNEEQWTRLYYKNNLYEFCDNPTVSNLVINILMACNAPFVDPNSPPKEVEEMGGLELFYDLLKEFVYYGHQLPSKLDKMDALIRDVSIIQDTDSCIVCFDAWFRFILQKTQGIDMPIKHTEFDMVNEKASLTTDIIRDYDFYNDEIIEMKRSIKPTNMIVEDGFRHSILAVLSHCVGRLVNEYVAQMCRNFNAWNENVPCAVLLKTEFLFRRILITLAKKHYASIQELQEGNKVPEAKSLDIKGMEAFVKSTMNPNTQERLKKILYEDILNTPAIDQVKTMKEIALVEKDIFDSITGGHKEYYKPVKVRAASSYESPMFIQGIKAAVAYNALHEQGTEAIDTTIRNSLDVIKTEITPKNISKIEHTHPDVYAKAVDLMTNDKYYAGGIDAIAVPMNEPVPEWVLPFVRYSEIISDNVGKFPLESIGMHRGNANNNYTNIVEF